MPEYHAPVLGEEVSRFAQDRKRVVDCTVGDGGHTRLFLEAGARVLAVDRDPDALRVARGRLDDGCLQWLGGSFASPDVLAAVRDFKPDMVLLDLGVSSRQLDQDSRGFTFRPGVPLDMRMEVGRGETAARGAESPPTSRARENIPGLRGRATSPTPGRHRDSTARKPAPHD